MAIPGTEAEVFGWTSQENLKHHFNPYPGSNHGAQMRYTDLRRYAQGGRNNITAPGTISRPGRGGTKQEGTTGHFNPSTRHLTITNKDGKIITYMPSRINCFNRWFGE